MASPQSKEGRTMDIKGRGVFLTGGGQGIGRAVTTALLQHGAKVVFCDINADVGKDTEAELQKEYGVDNVLFVQCDITDTEQLKGAFDTAVSKLGAVEICINNAGILDERIWKKEIEVNLVAPITGSKLALEHMRRDKGGRGGVILHTASLAGLYSSEIVPVYVATKQGLVGYVTSCANDPDMPALGVRWGCVCPDFVDTKILDFNQDDQDRICHFDFYQKNFEHTKMKTDVVAKAYIQMIQDVDSNGKLMMVTKNEGGVYKRRALVQDDGVSGFNLVDKSLEHHPLPPGHTQ